MKKVELYLMYLNKLKKTEQSIDIYFNDLVPEFVVRIINNLDNNKQHFQNIKLKAAIEEAMSYLLKENN